MGPLSFLYGTAVFLPACLTATGCLANVNLIAFLAYILVYCFLFFGVNFSLVFVAKDIGQFGARLEAGVNTSFG